MTPVKRAQLAAKYNMRAEDYTPCAWTADDGHYGDYPVLNHENAAARNADYDWDDIHLRRNFGDPVPHDQVILFGSMPRTDSNIIYQPFTSHVTNLKLYLGFVVCAFLAIYAEYHFSLVKGYDGLIPNRKGDGFLKPWVQFQYGQFNQGGNHRDPDRFRGMCMNFEDDGFEKWGLRETVNYTIDGWEDL